MGIIGKIWITLIFQYLSKSWEVDENVLVPVLKFPGKVSFFCEFLISSCDLDWLSNNSKYIPNPKYFFSFFNIEKDWKKSFRNKIKRKSWCWKIQPSLLPFYKLLFSIPISTCEPEVQACGLSYKQRWDTFIQE